MGARILVCDDEAGIREMLAVLFRRSGHEVVVVGGVKSALVEIDESVPYDVIVTDLVMPDGSGMDVLSASRAREEATQVVMITAYATAQQAVEAMRKGAYDYVQKPFRNEALLATIDKALEKRVIVDENRTLRAQVEGGFEQGGLIGKSPAMRKVMELVTRIGKAPTSVLLTGESGTGKEVVARAIHRAGPRGSKPFVAINCGALPEALMESELFGHEKGAFTGATHAKEGLFRAAAGGTVFLDEVGELPASLQVKLLRVLQERRVRPVGSQEELAVDARVVAATNRDVEKEVAEGTFRQDLFYRLNVIRLELPPLRDRPEDIPVLAEHFLRKHGALQGKRLTINPEAMRWIASQPYPGNVRELENIIERAVTLALEDTITREDLPDGGDRRTPAPSAMSIPDEGLDLDNYLGDVEKRLLLRALAKCGGVRTRAAKLLGMSFRSFRYRLAKYDLGDEDDSAEDDSAEDGSAGDGAEGGATVD